MTGAYAAGTEPDHGTEPSYGTMSNNPRLGRYEILRRIASGGMATVYLGRALGEGGFQRLVAVKMMHPHLAEDPEFVAMFLDEARLAASIRHPNVVATVDVQRAPEGLFLVMDYIDGPTLSRIIKVLERTQRPMDLGIALRIFLDTLAGLDAAHELIGPTGEPLHLIHRDISPSNVLVGSDGIARITDFGIARAEARITSTRGRQLKGKLPYMAPEQLSSNPIDRRVDVYAAGCVLWEMLTLRRLFQGDDEAQLLAGVLQGAQQPPSAYRSDVPTGIDMVCMQALGKLDYRFRSAAFFAEAVEDAARREGVRIASLRDVGRFVKELSPGAHDPAPSVGSDPGAGSGSGSSVARMGVSTPQRWQATPPPGAGSGLPLAATTALPVASSPSVPPLAGARPLGSSPGFPAPGRSLTHPGLPEAVPTTNSSVIAMPVTPGIRRHKVMVTMVGALGLAVLGVAVAYLATGEPPTQPDPGGPATTSTQSSTEQGAGGDPQTTSVPSSDPTLDPSAKPTAEPKATTTRRPGGTPTRTRPDPKATATPKQPPPPPPPPTGTEFRPALP